MHGALARWWLSVTGILRAGGYAVEEEFLDH